MRHLDLNIDNSTLVEECRGGDREAMSILYTRFAPRMLHVISRYVPDRDSASDILHDGFIAAFTRLETLRDPERIDFWLASIMKNLSLKFLQAQSVTSLLEEIPETIEEPDIDQILDFTTIESLIRQLPEGYQKVFRLAVLENKSHKEISEILGIAPNSSSSQLFHAKLRLRQLIKDYQLRAGLISLLLLLVSAGLLFLTRQPDDMLTSGHLSADNLPKKVTSRPIRRPGDNHKGPSAQSAAPATARTAGVNPAYAQTAVSPATVTTPAAETIPAAVDIPATPTNPAPGAETDHQQNDLAEHHTDAKPIAETSDTLDNDPSSFYDRLLAEVPHRDASDKGWSAGISVDPGMMSFNNVSDSNMADDLPWDDPNLGQHPSGPDDDDSTVPAMRAAGRQDIESYLGHASRRHHLPISFALTAEKHFTPWLGLESGIGYSYLHTDFERHEANGSNVSTCHWHYLEIPLKVNLYAYTSPAFKLYGSFGGRVAIPVYSYAQIAPNSICRSGRFDSKAVWSVGASVGAAIRLSKRVDLFIEPSIRYHFPQDCAIPNIWTDDERWSLSIPLGIRLSW